MAQFNFVRLLFLNKDAHIVAYIQCIVCLCIRGHPHGPLADSLTEIVQRSGYRKVRSGGSFTNVY